MRSKTFNLFLFLLCCIFLISCSKDESTNPLENDSEQYYKSKLEKIVHLKLLDPKTPIDSANHLTFNSYKEFYEHFKLLDGSNGVTVFRDTIKPLTDPPAAIKKNISSLAADVRYYSQTVTNNRSVSGLYGTGIVGAVYQLSFSIGYPDPPNSGSAHIISSSPSSPVLSYSGVGSASGSATFNQVLPYSGSYSGVMNGTASIAGISVSFYINVSGSYGIQPGVAPAYIAVVTSTLVADAH